MLGRATAAVGSWITRDPKKESVYTKRREKEDLSVCLSVQAVCCAEEKSRDTNLGCGRKVSKIKKKKTLISLAYALGLISIRNEKNTAG